VLRSKEAIEDEIAGLLGGRVAEELLCGSVTTGAANDLEKATALARAMVTQYGMSGELGLRTFESAESEAVIGWPTPRPTYAEGTALRIDAEIKGILDRAHARAKAALRERWGTLARLAAALLEHETLERSDIERLLAESDPGTEVPCAEEVAA
jgi:cell division protease FtsH